jgi:hypothetical protein
LYPLILVIPVAASLLLGVTGFYALSSIFDQNPYKYLDQKQYEDEFKREFPYGVTSIFSRRDLSLLKGMEKKYEDIGINLLKVKGGIKLQEKLFREYLIERKKKKKVKTVNKEPRTKVRSMRSEQNIDIKFLKNRKRKRFLF